MTSPKTENALMGSPMTENGKAAGNKHRIGVVLFVNKIPQGSATCGPQAGFLPSVLTPNPTKESCCSCCLPRTSHCSRPLRSRQDFFVIVHYVCPKI